MATSKSNAIVKQLAKVLEDEARSGMNYEFDGEKWVIPGHINNLRDAADVLYEMNSELEEEVSNRHAFLGHPNELLYAFYSACEYTFGKMTSKGTQSFFGNTPGETRNIDISFNEKVTVPYGKVTVPGLPIDMYIEVQEQRTVYKSKMVFNTTCRRKYEALVNRIISETERFLLEKSIFAGKALDSSFNFLDVNGFDLESVIYGKEEFAQLRANIFRFVEETDVVTRDLGMSLNRKVLLYGSYGTGKSLTARYIAHLCGQNGWTYLQSGDDDFETVLSFAQQKKLWPMVIFKEDVDTDTGAERDREMNRILNQLDGALTKDAQVFTVLTTNHIDEIQAAMNRPGRTDAQLEIGNVDSDVLERIVRYHCRHVELEEFDADALMEVAVDYTPAFIVEACKRAMLYTENGKIITHEALRRALESLRAQYDRMMVVRENDPNTIEATIRSLTKTEARNARQTQNNEIEDMLDQRFDA